MASEKNAGRQFQFEMTVRHGEGRLIPSFIRDGWMSFLGVLSGKVRIQAGLFSREASEGEILFVAPSRLLFCETVDGPAEIRLMTFHESILCVLSLNPRFSVSIITNKKEFVKVFRQIRLSLL